MSIEVLSVGEALAAGVPVHDVYAHPAYGASAALVDDGTWEVCADLTAGTCFPYVRRPVPGRPELFDIVSPYGYGGLSSHPATSLADERRFRARFLEVLRARGCVAEFLRLGPLDRHEAVLDTVDTIATHPTFGTVVEDPDTVAATTSGPHRTAVRRAFRSGLTVHAAEAASLRDDESPFRRIYAATMSRVGARAALEVDGEYFDRLLGLPSEALSLLEAHEGDEVTAAAIFLRWGDRVHYHLSGSTPRGRDLQATNLLLDHAMTRLTPAGGVLHLGGGLGADDGLSRFKRRCSNTTFSMALTRLVLHPGRYQRLTEGLPETAYFPAYRAPGAT